MLDDDDVIEAIRLARVLIEKLDALGAKLDAIEAIIRDDETPRKVSTENLIGT